MDATENNTLFSGMQGSNYWAFLLKQHNAW